MWKLTEVETTTMTTATMRRGDDRRRQTGARDQPHQQLRSSRDITQVYIEILMRALTCRCRRDALHRGQKGTVAAHQVEFVDGRLGRVFRILTRGDVNFE